jgi:hypothetical protein
MRRHLAYLQYVLRHKWYVLNAGWSLGIPLLALLHDNSKFLRDEWGPYARHFYNPDGSKRTHLQKDGFYTDDPGDAAFERAWLTHIRRNKHHPQYWVTVIWTPCGDSGRGTRREGRTSPSDQKRAHGSRSHSTIRRRRYGP